MNSRSAIGEKALILKEDHGFALGVREMKVFEKSPLDYMTLRDKSRLKLSHDIVLGQAFHVMLSQGAEKLKVNSCANNKPYKHLTHFSSDESFNLSAVDIWRLNNMQHNFYNNREIRELFQNTQVYKTCGGLFVEDISGCECFFNADFILPAKGCVIDVKTCRDTSPDALEAEIKRFKYHWQAWWAKTGAGYCFEMPVTDFAFVFVGQSAPFDVAVYQASGEMLDMARDELQPYINLYNQFFTSGHFGGFLLN